MSESKFHDFHSLSIDFDSVFLFHTGIYMLILINFYLSNVSMLLEFELDECLKKNGETQIPNFKRRKKERLFTFFFSLSIIIERLYIFFGL